MKTRIVSITLLVAIVVSGFFIAPKFSAEATTSTLDVTQAQAIAWLTQVWTDYNADSANYKAGKLYGDSGNAQCVHLILHTANGITGYMNFLGSVPSNPGNAVQYAKKPLTDYYTRYTWEEIKDSGYDIRPGDIFIKYSGKDNTPSDTVGHIGVIMAHESGHTYQTLENNIGGFSDINLGRVIGGDDGKAPPIWTRRNFDTYDAAMLAIIRPNFKVGDETDTDTPGVVPTATPTAAPTATPTDIVKLSGDFTGVGTKTPDGTVDIWDVRYLHRALMEWSDYSVENGDFNHDGTFSIADVRYLHRYVMKWSGYELE